jgi:hypothetical protein
MPASALARRVLAMLRARFIEDASGSNPPPASAELLPVLVALERVDGRLAPTLDQRVADRM